MMKIFFEDGRLRPYLRFLASVFGILTVVMTVGFVAITMPPLFPWLSRGLTLLSWFNLLLLLPLLGLYMLLSRLLEQRVLGSVGFALHPRWENELGIGLAAGTAMIVAAAGSAMLLGDAKFSLSSLSPGKVVLAGAFFFLLFAVAAANEELVFRGYPFQRLVDVCGPVLAVIVRSVLFGAVHLRNPFHTWISTLNTVLMGVLLAICYLRTRALWLPLGIHFALNFVQGYLLGLPVSGMRLPESFLQAKAGSPVWITVGAYGLEGSILTLGIIVAGTVYFFASKRIFPTGEMWDLALGPRGGKEKGNVLFSRDSFPVEKC